MSIFNDFLSHFPPDVQDTIRTIWDALDGEQKNGFLSLIGGWVPD